jgi:hypothetical protein
MKCGESRFGIQPLSARERKISIKEIDHESRVVFTKGVSQAVGLLHEPGGLEAA